MKKNKIIIAGGSGFIGQSLVKYLGKDNHIIILGRQGIDAPKNFYGTALLTEKQGYNTRYIKWNGREVNEDWLKEIDGSDLIINLAGKSVNCRYHKNQKREIIDSRIFATRAIGEAIRKTKSPPPLWINAASATIYANSYDSPNDELTGKISEWKKDNMPYTFIDNLRHKKNRLLAKILYGSNSGEYKDLERDFSVQVCRFWEKAFFEEETKATRKIALRMAITLGKGGVITPYLALCKYGLGGKQGTGRQFFSWVHEEDIARMIGWLCEKPHTKGIYNCAAPNAVSNYSFMKTLRECGGYKIGLPAPACLLETGAFLIGTETELILKSRWVVPRKALQEGFIFKYPLLKDALTEILSERPSNSH